MRQLLLIFVMFVAGCTCPYGHWSAPPPSRSGIPVSEIHFLDGDTFRYHGETVRLLGCDTAECDSSYHHGNQEPWGSRGTEFARKVTQGAVRRTVEYAPINDKYGRRLAHLVLDGVPLAVLLVREGLAYESISRYGDNGFAEYAKMILDAAKKPEFEDPWQWRRNHRK